MASLIFSLVLVMFLFIINLSYGSDLITQVCSKSQNKHICYNALKSDPRSTKADLKGLGFIAIEISTKDAKNTYYYVKSLLNQGQLNRPYDDCLEYYENTIIELDEARKALALGDIGGYRIRASAAYDGPGYCKEVCKDSPTVPSKLQAANTKSQALIGIVLVVGAILAGDSI